MAPSGSPLPLPMTIPLRPSGLASTASALQMLERRQAVLANNLANASTRGFKAEHPFARLLEDARAVTDTVVDTTAGTVTQTGNPLDLALEGDGFFVTQTPGGERLVRTGSFQLDAERRLVDGRGNPLLGEEGPIVLRPGAVTVDATGMVEVNGRPVQRLRLERVDDPARLQHEGGRSSSPTTPAAPSPPPSAACARGRWRSRTSTPCWR